MIALTRRYAFPAAHVLASRELSFEENCRVFGKCANPNGHGHDYEVEVTVTGPLDPETGHIVPPAVLDRLFEERVAARYAHRMLNEIAPFTTRVPTAENIAAVLHDELAPAIASAGTARLARVRVVETPNNSFESGDPR